jgi:hypothetical protein
VPTAQPFYPAAPPAHQMALSASPVNLAISYPKENALCALQQFPAVLNALLMETNALNAILTISLSSTIRHRNAIVLRHIS